ncbi:MAG TPA: BON domain-containing protein [Burkholderiales bacterium]|nr:BON domain-containing protein [Burkholderiales bacterium]
MNLPYRRQHAEGLTVTPPRSAGYPSLIGSLGAGALLMYLMDPQRGRRRRALVRDQLVHVARRVRQARRVTAADIANRSSGLWAMTRRWLHRGREASDRDIPERVRARLGRVVSHPHAIEVVARDGHVTLSGPILLDEVQPLISTVQRTEGVRAVEDRLAAYAEPGGVSALQGGRRRSDRFEFFQHNWSPAARLTAGVLGAGLMLCASRQRSAWNLALAALGGGLLLRAATNRELISLWRVVAGSEYAPQDAARPTEAGSSPTVHTDEIGTTLPPAAHVGQNTRVS